MNTHSLKEKFASLVLAFLAAIGLIIGLARSPQAQAQTAAPRVMFIGDSITQGFSWAPSFRGPTVTGLASMGRPIQTVGSRSDAAGAHEGYGGLSSCDFQLPRPRSYVETNYGKSATWDITTMLRDAAPTYAVVELGTNNYVDSYFGTPASNPCNLQIENLRRLYDNVLLRTQGMVVMTVKVNEPAQPASATDVINAPIRQWVATRRAQGYNVCLAETPEFKDSVFTSPGDPWHPNAAGIAAIAAVVRPAIVSMLDGTCAAGAPAPTTTTSTSTTTTTAAPTTTTTTTTTTPPPPPSGTMAASDRLYPPAVVAPSSISLPLYPVTNGQRITFNCGGTINGIWWYKTAADTGNVTVSVYDGTTKALLSSGVGSFGATTGWTYQQLSAPVTVAVGKRVILAAHHPNGSYAYGHNGFTGRSVTSTSGCVTSPASTGNQTAAGNGLYEYGAAPTAPLFTYLDSEYFMMPEFVKA